MEQPHPGNCSDQVEQADKEHRHEESDFALVHLIHETGNGVLEVSPETVPSVFTAKHFVRAEQHRGGPVGIPPRIPQPKEANQSYHVQPRADVGRGNEDAEDFDGGLRQRKPRDAHLRHQVAVVAESGEEEQEEDGREQLDLEQVLRSA